MPTILDGMTAVRDRLVAAGIRAVVDPRDLNPPAVYVAPPAVPTWRFAAGDYDGEFTLYCCALDAGRRVALAELAELVDRVRAALAGAPVEGHADDLVTGDGGPPLPCYALTFTTRVRSVDTP